MAQRKPDGVIRIAVYVAGPEGLVYETRTDSTPRLKNNKRADDFYRYISKAARAWVDNQEGEDLPVPDPKQGSGFKLRKKSGKTG